MTSISIALGLVLILGGVIAFSIYSARGSGRDKESLDVIGSKLDSLKRFNLEMSRGRKMGKDLVGSIRARASRGLRNNK
tara:strand:- start:713 stop:949 length:237 start_codon:yes stop_codon:yes gene_type:complete